MTKTGAKVITFLFLHSTVSFAMNVHLSDEKITTTKGMEVDLICSTDSEALGCSFKSPAEHNYNMLRGAAYEEGRIQQKEMNPKDCALRIIRVRQSDNGDWKCNVTAKVSFSSYQRNLIKTFQIEGVIALITKITLIFSSDFLNGQK